MVPVGAVPVLVVILYRKGCCKHGIGPSVDNDHGGGRGGRWGVQPRGGGGGYPLLSPNPPSERRRRGTH